MNINPIRFLKEKLVFQEKEKENIELSQVSRIIYNKILPNFPSFKLVDLVKKSETEFEGVGRFLFKRASHLVKFAVKKEDNEVKIDVDKIKETLDNVSESYPNEFSLSNYLKENENSLEEILKEVATSKEYLIKPDDEFKGIPRIIKFFFEETLTKKGNIEKDDLKKLINDIFINENYLVDPGEIKEVIAKSKKTPKNKKIDMFKRELPYDLTTDEGEVKKVKAVVYSKKEQPESEDDISLVFEGESLNKDDLDFYNEYYAFDSRIKGDVLNKVKKVASGTISVPWGYLSPVIRLNKDFLPPDLEEGDVIEVDGFNLKLINKKENLLSTKPQDEGSYWVFEVVSSVSEDKVKDKKQINNL